MIRTLCDVRVPHAGEIIPWRETACGGLHSRSFVRSEEDLVVRLRDSFGQAEKARGREAAQCGQRRRVAREKRRWTHASRRRRTIRVLGAGPALGGCRHGRVRVQLHLVNRREESDITVVDLAVLHHELAADPLRWFADFAMKKKNFGTPRTLCTSSCRASSRCGARRGRMTS